MIDIELTDDSNANDRIGRSYDEVPYESFPYPASHIYHMMTLGVLWGMSPVKPENARVLELGCAGGGNIIPHAVNFPKAKFIGIDLSEVQVNFAKRVIEDLKLKNIEVHHCSITDVDEKFGKFDYIVCHGVISWVPDAVKQKIFSIVKSHLNPQGIAYISYNVFPGWNMIRSVRDMMLYHANNFSDPHEQILQSRLFVEFVNESLAGQSTSYAMALKKEAELLASQTDHYLRHEHLSENNQPYYFHEFIAEARKYNLQYLSDSNLASMYLGNMPTKVAEKLKVVNNIVRIEQYMDFLTNRRFRTTLLCHDSVALRRNLDTQDILKFYVSMPISPERPFSEININDSMESLSFGYNNSSDNKMSTSSPCMKAILYSFAEQKHPIEIDTLIVNASKKFEDDNKQNEIRNEFLANAMHLTLKGYMHISVQEFSHKLNLDKPCATRLARYQASANDNNNNIWVTNLHHEPVVLNILEKYVIRYMDGKNDKFQIVDHIMKHVQSKEITVNKNDQPVEDLAEVHQELVAAMDHIIENIAKRAILV